MQHLRSTSVQQRLVRAVGELCKRPESVGGGLWPEGAHDADCMMR